MPITPIHLGPALAVKAAAPGRFSFLVFALTQVVIDSEAAFYLLFGEWPIHRLLHTLLGATLVAAVTVVVGRPLLERSIGLWVRFVARSRDSLLWVEPRISPVAAASGALAGGYSHVLLDSIVHWDVRPFAPWSDGNPLLHLVSNGHLVLACLALGVLGAVALLISSIRRRPSVPSPD